MHLTFRRWQLKSDQRSDCVRSSRRRTNLSQARFTGAEVGADPDDMTDWEGNVRLLQRSLGRPAGRVRTN